MESKLAFISFIPRAHIPTTKSVSTSCSFIPRSIQHVNVRRNLRTSLTPDYEAYRRVSITTSATAAEEKNESVAEEMTDEEIGAVQGPSQAPTQPGVSTAGLAEDEKEFIEACYNADVSAIEKGLDKGIDVRTCDVNGRTALHFCAGNGLKTICIRLLEKDSDINKQDILGYTPMHMAAGYKMVNTVSLLVDRGADANLASFDGKLPVELAEDLLEKTPEKKFFRPNEEYKRLQEIVQVLDNATELEDDDDDDDDEVSESKSFTQEEGDIKYEVRIAGKKNETTEAMKKVDVKTDDVKVTIRIKEPEAKKKE